MTVNTCRFCNRDLNVTFIDLGKTPLSNAYLKNETLKENEPCYPLHVKICENCFLVQLPEFEKPENIFTDYAYLSSYSDSWLQHCSDYTYMMVNRFAIDKNAYVVELASNDGYLLQYFKAKEIPVLGIEPAKNVAQIALEKGISTVSVFFSKSIAEQMKVDGKQATLIIANNVLAHVPNLNDFVAGMKVLLAPNGIITIEFPHLLSLIENNQFDTIYHEHFSYFSLLTAQRIFQKHALEIFDVEKLSVHGGSLRLFIKHRENANFPISINVAHVIAEEKSFGLDKLETYRHFSKNIEILKSELCQFIHDIKQSGKKIAAYGAPAKGNTLLNYCDISNELISFTVDRNPLKQGCLLPGTHIPILHPDTVKEKKPDYLLVLAWNLKDEIMEQMAYIKEWDGKFVIPIPQLQVM